MLYAILGREAEHGSALRPQHREAHIAHLKILLNQGRLVLAGPRPSIDAEEPGPAGFSGSLIVAEFDDLAAARAWADADPYMIGGVFETADVYPFVQVFP